ncbi:uncharacterized protein Eint_010590 [Encephalitozoon intestinalis ATCC 50506]|uniref:Uncharacterized protein n=1 Tax=Encephalitozoon intestinalis (strain ATCC 50506) TaxID=876142 RepID=E0S5D7_ENCIT|nr:uncharacterized protein Eint_010590 [Encephalitozoon intestinalis ATCC 50506]ADM10922.1 hypothetical protein Eint_010590 [Encephalitozoon intestinalis ATCC 50506]UTX44556.1 hypothetical protein GPK93_01g00650 [Encephalitozoon intestinalis]
MCSPEDIIREASITTTEPRRFPSLETVSGLEIPRTASIRSLDDLNTMYREMEFPTIEERMLEDHMALIDVLNNLSIEYDRYGLEISSELEELRKKQEKISLCNEYEKECDILEVELANMKQKYEEMKRYSQYDIEDLKSRLEDLRKMFNDMEYEKLHASLLSKVWRFLEEGSLPDEDVISSLSYIKESREYSCTIEKMLVIEEIENLSDSHNKIICKHLVLEESIELDRLGKMVGMDRATLLRIVYGLLSKGIIVFDRSGDRICLQR